MTIDRLQNIVPQHFKGFFIEIILVRAQETQYIHVAELGQDDFDKEMEEMFQ